MNEFTSNHIHIFNSLFKGREDVFVVRWEKSGNSGYMPAYQYDPSWLLVADFDKKNYKEEAVTFLNACKGNNIPAHLERSRSGNGGHVWIFFDKPYPAIPSRKIFISILEQSGAFSMFDKSSSFDRLFPNQDFLSGKGLGNLIALPFFKPAMEKGNSCFINPETFEPHTDQWQLLNEIERVSLKCWTIYLRKPQQHKIFQFSKFITVNYLSHFNRISVSNEMD